MLLSAERKHILILDNSQIIVYDLITIGGVIPYRFFLYEANRHIGQ